MSMSVKATRRSQCLLLTTGLKLMRRQKSTEPLTIVKPSFVPDCEPVDQGDVDLLQSFIDNNRALFVMTGAGISTESGIPDYRSEGVGLYARSTNRPVQYQDFVKSEKIRQRYWARNFVGWPRFSSFPPNISHKILSDWEKKGLVHWLVTQNVDALHFKAGSHNVTELHGSSHRVMCLSCNFKMPRTQLQNLLTELNPSWHAESVDIAPDGDVQLTQKQIEGFKVPACPKCGGNLKPEIVFFGDNVPKDRVNFVFSRLDECEAVLVLGSSLEVFSGYRFVSKAFEQKKPIALVNIGNTRADNLANLKISAKCSEVLMKIHI